jgi:hypothetical protein
VADATPAIEAIAPDAAVVEVSAMNPRRERGARSGRELEIGMVWASWKW